MEPMGRAIWAWALGAVLAACSSGDGGGGGTKACVDTWCAPGETRCIGNAMAQCNDDGTGWSLNDCGATARCAGEGTRCDDRQCVPGAASCADFQTVSRCGESGTAQTQETCGPGTVCAAGACRAVPCTPGDVACGWRAAALCGEDGNWDVTACEAGQTCVDGQCVAERCTPGARACASETAAQVCRLDGSGWDEEPCGEGERCYEAYAACLPALCTEPTAPPDASGGEADAGEGDAAGDAADGEETPGPGDEGPPPAELEPLDRAEAVIDGEKVVFTSHASASYNMGEKDLRISMDEGPIKIEISVKPIEEFDVGSFSSDVPSDVNVIIFYDDGTAGRVGGAFAYQSVDYTLDLIKFQAPGGRVVGEFSATVTKDGGVTTLPITEGYFDVGRHD